MGLLTRLFERRYHPSNDIDWEGLFGVNTTSYAGASVTPDSALTFSAYYACIRVIAESLASLPLLTYLRQPDGGKKRAPSHPLYRLLKEQANPEMTAFEVRETLTAHAAGWGNGYAEIEWSNGGQPLALWPLNPAKMEDVVRVNGQLRYLYRSPDGTLANLPAYRIHHLRGLSSNGIVGYSVARMAMQAIGLGLGTEEFGARFFGNGARPGIVLKHPGVLSEKGRANLQKSWNAELKGLSNAHRLRVLEEGMGIETVGVPPEEAQFLETRKFQVSEIARWFRIPPHMLGDLDKATFSNIEHLSIDFVVHTLRPWLVRSEQALTRDLLTQEEQKTLFIEYLVEGLLRGDTKSRYEAYSVGRQNGWLSANDIRRLENMNPINGGDIYLVPLNMVPADQAKAAPTSMGRGVAHHPECRCAACWASERRQDDTDVEDDDSADGESDHVKEWRRSKQKLARDFIPVFADVAGRMVRREVADIRRAINKHLRKRSLDDFRQWLSDFYGEFVTVLSDAFLATLQTYAAQVAKVTADELEKEDPGVTDEVKAFIKRYLDAFAEGYVASSQNQIEALITDAQAEGQDVGDAIEERLDGWEETRPDKVARSESFESGNALAIAIYVTFSIRRIRWAASGKSCPFCQRLNGSVVGIEQYFVAKGDSVNGGPDDAPMLVRRNTRHGPLHAGCDCIVVAD